MRTTIRASASASVTAAAAAAAAAGRLVDVVVSGRSASDVP